MNKSRVTAILILAGAAVAPATIEAAGAAATAAAAPLPIPPAVEILRTLHAGHPRLFLTAEGFADLKKRIEADPWMKGQYASLERDGRRMLGQPPSKYEIPDGKRLLATSRRVVERTQTLGLLYRLTGEKRYAERLWRELEAAGNFKDWNPSHFLDTAEMSAAFGIGYDWLYDAWTEEQRRFLRTALVGKGLQPALDSYEKKRGFWGTCHHNWNQVCNGGIGIGALALADVEPELTGRFLGYALNSIQGAMREFGPDGAWAEGPGYWGYATMYNVAFLSALDSALGRDFGLSGIPGFSDCGLFPIYATGPSNHSFNYADSGDGAPRAPQMFWLAERFQRPAYADYARRDARGSPMDLVYQPRKPLPATAETLPLDKYFRNSEVVMLRGSWTDPRATWVGLKAGDNKANHSHLDLGSFVLDALGQRWAADLGGDDYNLPAYFGGQRWTYYRLRAEAHNTLVFNPGQGPDQDPRAVAPIVRFGSAAARAFAVADLTAASPSALSATRGVALLDRRNVLVQDEWRLKTPGEAWWFLHTPADVKLEAGGAVALLSLRGASLRATVLDPGDAAFTVGAVEPLPGSPNPPNQRKNRGIRTLAIHRSGAAGRLAVLFEPVAGDHPAIAPAPAIRPLAEW